MLNGDETRSHVLTWGGFFCFFFFLRLVYIFMCYRNVLYLLNCTLRLVIVVLLGCWEFNPNVTCVRIHFCSRIAIPHDAGAR